MNTWGREHMQLVLVEGGHGVVMMMGVGGVNREWVVNKTGSKPKR